MCLSQRRYDALPSLETELKVNNVMIANLRLYPLSCTVALLGILALSVFPRGHHSARYAQCEHRGRRLSHAAAKNGNL